GGGASCGGLVPARRGRRAYPGRGAPPRDRARVRRRKRRATRRHPRALRVAPQLFVGGGAPVPAHDAGAVPRPPHPLLDSRPGAGHAGRDSGNRGPVRSSRRGRGRDVDRTARGGDDVEQRGSLGLGNHAGVVVAIDRVSPTRPCDLHQGRMTDAEVTRVTPSNVTVRVGSRIVEVSGDAIIDKPMAPYFVYSNSITAWNPPHEHDPLSEHDKEVVLQAIRDHLDRKGFYYIIDPTDEQYRTL